MAGVTFIGSEVSPVRFNAATEVTTAGTFRSANSRGSIQTLGSTQSAWGEWDSSVSEGWIHWCAASSYDNDDSDNIIIVTDSGGANLFRLMTSGVNVIQAQYWASGAWQNVGATFTFNTAVSEIVVHLTAGSSGAFEVYNSGTLLRSGTFSSTATNMKRCTFYCSDDAQLPINYSEIMLGDSTYSLVGSVVETEAPTANGTDTTGTGSYTDVDEFPYSDADAITFAASGDRNSFTSPARTSTLSNVLGVSVGARMKRDASGPQNAKFYLKIGGTRYYSSTFALTLAYDAYQYTWQTNPSTGTAWTTTDANASTLEWGIEAVT